MKISSVNRDALRNVRETQETEAGIF